MSDALAVLFNGTTCAMDWPPPGGSVYRAGFGTTTVLPTFDFETASAAGYGWDPTAER